MHSVGFFVFNTNLTFLYKIDIEGFKKSKKVAFSGIWTHNSNHHWIRILTALPTQPPRHLLNRKSLNWSWIISRINRAWLYKGLKIWDCHGLTDWLSKCLCYFIPEVTIEDGLYPAKLLYQLIFAIQKHLIANKISCKLIDGVAFEM